ncbi:MAG: hypothetical protein ACRD0U_04180 [Acidimicrobiales bacterium]
MSVPIKLGGFALLLALVFGGGLALGAAFGPTTETPLPPPTHHTDHAP